MFKFALDGLQVDKQTLLEHWEGIAFKLGDFGTSAYLTQSKQTINEEAGTVPYEAPEMEALLTVQRDIEAKPCDVYSLAMTLADAMLASLFDDVANTKVMNKFMGYVAKGQAGREMACQLIRLVLLETRGEKYSEEAVINAIGNVFDEHRVCRLIYRMTDKRANKRITMQQVMEQIDKL